MAPRTARDVAARAHEGGRMSGDQPPPPGWQAPERGTPPQPWAQPTPPPGWPPAPPGADPRSQQTAQAPPAYADPTAVPVAMLVAHKPGAIPLRPLVLSDIFDGAFRIIRYNPRATIGAAVLVSAVAMIVPITAGLVSGSTGGLQPDPNTDTLSDSQVLSVLIGLAGLLAGAQLQSIGLLFVSGMIAHVS